MSIRYPHVFSPIRIRGVDYMHGSRYSVIPDQIETGTLMIAAAATHGDVIIRGCIPTHMEALTAKLLEMGVQVTDTDDTIRVRSERPHRAVNIKTQEYPGFPTDLQAPMMTVCCKAKGQSVFLETIFENRFRQVAALRRLGADITVCGRTAEIRGVRRLHGAELTATDLRGGASMILAGLCAEGETVVCDSGHITRGYDAFDRVLQELGADVKWTAIGTRDPLSELPKG